jgi:hypothetical protein
MTYCKACDEISDDVVLVSFEQFILFAEFVRCDYFFLNVFQGALTLLIVFLQDFGKKFFLVSKEGAHIIDGEFLEDHVVLGEGSGFVAENVLDSSEFLRDLAVSGEGSLDFFIVIDFSRKDDFGEVEVDSQADGDDAGQQ